MKIAFFGTPDFAGNILDHIITYPELDCVLVVSQPDRQVGRKKEVIPTPVKSIAKKYTIPVLQPEKIKNNAILGETLQSHNLDFIVVVAYGKIIPKEILGIPKYGCINIHGSILPKYRGASPVQAAIKSGDTETGLTIMYMSEGMDEGNMLKIEKVNIDNVDTSEDIFKKFIEIGPELLVSTLRGVVSGNIKSISQNDDEATYCGKISREDGEVSFHSQSAKEIYDTFRAYTPWPGIFTWYKGNRFVLEGVLLYEDSEENTIIGKIGELVKISKNRLGIVCNDKKILEIIRVKLEGKKSMDAMSFINGNKDVIGYNFK